MPSRFGPPSTSLDRCRRPATRSARCRNPRAARDCGTRGRLRSALQRGSRSSTYSLSSGTAAGSWSMRRASAGSREARTHPPRWWDHRQSCRKPHRRSRSSAATQDRLGRGQGVRAEHLLLFPISPRGGRRSCARTTKPAGQALWVSVHEWCRVAWSGDRHPEAAELMPARRRECSGPRTPPVRG